MLYFILHEEKKVHSDTFCFSRPEKKNSCFVVASLWFKYFSVHKKFSRFFCWIRRICNSVCGIPIVLSIVSISFLFRRGSNTMFVLLSVFYFVCVFVIRCEVFRTLFTVRFGAKTTESNIWTLTRVLFSGVFVGFRAPCHIQMMEKKCPGIDNTQTVESELKRLKRPQFKRMPQCNLQSRN